MDKDIALKERTEIDHAMNEQRMNAQGRNNAHGRNNAQGRNNAAH